MSQNQTPPLILRVKPPFYSDAALTAAGMDNSREIGFDGLLDDESAEKLNLALRATIEGQLEPDELRR